MPELDRLPSIEAPGPLRREPALDGVRGAALLGVMLFHFTMFEQSGQPLYRTALRLATAGWVGVDVFFVLSGFLITGILLDTKDGPCFFRNFYVRRALRMLPLYYAALAMAMLALLVSVGAQTPEARALLTRQVWLWTYATNIEFTIAGHWDFNIGRVWLNHFWSLAVEEQFYLVWPVVVLALSRRALAVSTLALAVAAPLLRAIMIADGIRPGIVLTFTPCRLDELALGALAAVLVRVPALRPPVLRALPCLTVAALPPLAWLLWTRKLYWLDPIVNIVASTPLAVLSAVVILRCALEPDSGLARLLRSRLLRFLGKYSYGTFVFHYMFWPLLEEYLPADRLTGASGSELLGLGGHVLIGVAVSLAAGFASYRFLERRFLELKGNFAYAVRVPTLDPAPRAEPAAAPELDGRPTVARPACAPLDA